MHVDPELASWQRQWQSHSAPAADIRQRVERETRRMQRWRVFEIANTVICCGGVVIWAIVARRADVTILASAICVLFAVAWGVSATLTRGVWAPLATTTTGFLELSIERCRRRLREMAVQCAGYVVLVTFDVLWLYTYRASADTQLRAFLTSAPLLAVWMLTAVLAAAAVWQTSRLRRELTNLLALRESLRE